MSPVFRFAPSPNGRLHLGHAYSALLNEALARERGGRFLLRIEDIDAGRSREAFVAGIGEDLAWLGLRWEEPVRRQSEHLGLYREAADSLCGKGLLYPCFCSRADLARASEKAGRRSVDPDGAPLYPGTCRGLAPGEGARRVARGEAHVWRLDIGKAASRVKDSLVFRAFERDGSERDVACDATRWGDVVLVRRDVATSYHLAVVADDAAQAVSHVVRGRDLEAATDIHVLLQRLLALETPRYHHHALITDEAGLKLAKSRGSESLADLRARGIAAVDVRVRLGFAA